MLKCNGFKMFSGTATITPALGAPFKKVGIWLYRPDKDCWYCQGTNSWCESYPAEIVSDFVDECQQAPTGRESAVLPAYLPVC